MKRLTVALALFTFLALGAGMARADHYDRYHHHRHYVPVDRCERVYYTPRYVETYYPACRPVAPVYVVPARVVPYCETPRVGISVATPGFSLYLRK